MNKPLFKSGADWTPELLNQIWEQIAIIAKEELWIDPEKDLYKNQIEVVTAEQMLDCYSSVGLPNMYEHWSFGKDFIENWERYKQGEMGLAYELVISSDPCINYLMEENDATMQALVLSHAAVGHNFVFKNNYLFKEWSNADSIIDYVAFAKDYIRQCEEKYGPEEVEEILDACHALQNHGVDKYKRKGKKNEKARQALQEKLYEDELKYYDDVMHKTLPPRKAISDREYFDPQENILYFIEKKAPRLEPWKREIIRIVRKIAQYFYPQSIGTKVVHEGMASFCHFYIMTRLEEKGFLDAGSYLSFLKSHTSVVMQPGFDSKWYNGFNPYHLGFNILMDLKRAATNPTEEDRVWLPNVVDRPWQEVIKEAVSDYKDDAFIMQYLSPAMIRHLKLFEIQFDYDDEPVAVVTEIHDELGYQRIREQLAKQHNREQYVPNVEVVGADLNGDRVLTLRYTPSGEKDLNSEAAFETLYHLGVLWQYDIDLIQEIEGVDEIIASFEADY